VPTNFKLTRTDSFSFLSTTPNITIGVKEKHKHVKIGYARTLPIFLEMIRKWRVVAEETREGNKRIQGGM